MTNEMPKVGAAVDMEKGIRRILAPNPSPMTYWGTNTYLVGSKKVAVIDPGPEDRSHFDAIRAATDNGASVTHIVVTHAHVDHSAGAPTLAEMLDVPIVAFGPANKGISPLMQKLLSEGMESGGEGIDHQFRPDIVLEDGETLEGEDWRLEAIWTPGHISNHLCLALDSVVFTGDHVMEWATSIVSPPDGDVGAFMASCQKLLQRNDRIYYPGHGNPVLDPKGRTQWLVDHRRERERQIMETLQGGALTPHQIVEKIYVDVPKALFGAARRNVFAHLIDLHERDKVEADPSISDTATYRIK